MAGQPGLIGEIRVWKRLKLELIGHLRGVVGHKYVITDAAATLPYRTGYRIGGGDVLAVARPSSLVELWRVAQLCTLADVIIIILLDRSMLGAGRLRKSPADRLLQFIGQLAPHPLPSSIRKLAASREHMLLVTMADEGIDEARNHFRDHQIPSLTMHECTPKEAAALQRLRFATAGAMVRFSEVEAEAGPLVALDCALPRNVTDWQISLPPQLARQVMVSAIYGHFLCHVFHLDFVLRPESNADAFEKELVLEMHKMGVECPAEHNFGHHYHAPDTVVDFYRTLDPTNSLNPGIGQTSRSKFWQ